MDGRCCRKGVVVDIGCPDDCLTQAYVRSDHNPPPF